MAEEYIESSLCPQSRTVCSLIFISCLRYILCPQIWSNRSRATAVDRHIQIQRSTAAQGLNAHIGTADHSKRKRREDGNNLTGRGSIFEQLYISGVY